jgi:hypothetical protein
VLAQPAVWADASGDGKRKLDARIQELNNLTPAEQKTYDGLTQESRALGRQAREVDKSNKAEAQRFRARSNELALQAKALRTKHQEEATSKILDANAEFALFNIKPAMHSTQSRSNPIRPSQTRRRRREYNSSP